MTIQTLYCGAFSRSSLRMTNQYSGKCIECRQPVPKGAGECRKSKKGRWYVLCSKHTNNAKPAAPPVFLTVREQEEDVTLRAEHEALCRAYPQSNVATFAGGNTLITNRKGRCEDAPCCGCCS